MFLYKEILGAFYFTILISFTNSQDSVHTRSEVTDPEGDSSEWYEYNADYHEGLDANGNSIESRESIISPSYNQEEVDEGRIVREIEMCASRGEIHRSIKALDCAKPVLKTVKLKPPGPNYVIVPSVARVNKCSGHCSHPRFCLPSKKRTIRIPVYKFDKTNASNPPICVEYDLNEDVECRCECAVGVHHCTGNQIYDATNCACRCSNQEEKDNCLGMNMVWDDNTCNCKCFPRLCGNGMVWVSDSCRCFNIPDDEESGENLLYL